MTFRVPPRALPLIVPLPLLLAILGLSARDAGLVGGSPAVGGAVAILTGLTALLGVLSSRALVRMDLARARAEARVHLEEQFRALLDTAPDGVVVTERDGRIRLVNAQTERLFGYAREELIGEPVEKLIPSRFHEVHAHHRERYHGAPRTRPMGTPGMALVGRRKDGSEFPAEISLSPTPSEEGTLATAVVRDVSDRRKLEEVLRERADELARSNAELEQFAYVVSHDLQEPLRMVASFTQLLAKRYQGKLGEDADQFIGYAVDGAVRMRGLINDLLAYSRVGSRAAAPEPVSCEQALLSALDNLRASIEESSAVVTHDPLPTVRADRAQLEQLFQNLVGNAVKFHGKEAPRVHVSAARTETYWTVSVRDHGIGIDPQYAERIFLIFQRLHARGEYPGTGIGLAISKKIVERWGGKIWVESKAGEGATFRFTLPSTAPLASP